MNKNRQLSQKRCVVGQKANVFFLTYPCTFDFTTIQKKLVYRFGFETMQTALGNFIFLNKNRHSRSVDGGILVWWLFSRYFPKIWNLNLPKLLTDRKKLTGARRTTSSKTIPKSVHICPISSKRLFLTIFRWSPGGNRAQKLAVFLCWVWQSSYVEFDSDLTWIHLADFGLQSKFLFWLQIVVSQVLAWWHYMKWARKFCGRSIVARDRVPKCL